MQEATTALWLDIAATIADSQDFWTDFNTFDGAISRAARVMTLLKMQPDPALLRRPSFPPPKND